jgi:hypothetical protein
MDEGVSQTPDTEAVRGRFEFHQARLNAAKIAYLNGTLLDGQEVGYETLKRIAQEAIQANYELQKARYGRIRVKLSVPKLLRRGR